MSSSKPVLAEGASEEVERLAETLMTSERDGWTLSADGKGLERTFQFKRFKDAWAFMTNVAAMCKKYKHHPEWSNVYNQVFIRWTTHRPPGLSIKDVEMAQLCNELAANESLADDTNSSEGTLRGLADGLAETGRDCCKPSQ